MKHLILGAAGFIGKNLVKALLWDRENQIMLFDRETADFSALLPYNKYDNYEIVRGDFYGDMDFNRITQDVDIVYHLISTTIPNASNKHIAHDIIDNVEATSLLLDACVKNKVRKILFLSSGGTVYGLEKHIPFKEETLVNPISAYGLQKVTIEKLLYLYYYIYGLDYRIIRLSNPYGRFQIPNGIQGVVNTFLYKALKNETLIVYGDGKIVRDFIYIDDVVEAIKKIVDYEGEYKVFNVGSGIGHSVNELIQMIEHVLNKSVLVSYSQSRKADVPVNVLDISRYEKCFGKTNRICLEHGLVYACDYLAALLDNKIEC